MRAVRTRVVSAPALFALLPVLGVRPPCLWCRPPVVVRVRVLCYDLCHMSPPGLRPRAAASAVPPVAPPAGSPVDPAAARLRSLSPAAAPFSPASTAFPHLANRVFDSYLQKVGDDIDHHTIWSNDQYASEINTRTANCLGNDVSDPARGRANHHQFTLR